MRHSFWCGKFKVWCSKEDKPFLKCMEDNMLDRIRDWQEFSRKIERHINVYTIPQYQSEDRKEDQINISTAQECITAIKKYTNRFGKNARGTKEALRDMLKIAHYAQFGYDKLKVELNEGDVYEEV